MRSYLRSPHVSVQIRGRSGSGKSTIIRQIQDELANHGVRCNILSTDDYHRGATWLREYNNGTDWSEWDQPIVYDTALLAADLDKLSAGAKIPRRIIDFSVVEPKIIGEIHPAPITLLEGIYAGCDDLARYGTLKYDIPTPLATCIGRRLLRDIRERPQFADPAASLLYMLEQAEPMWREQLSVA